MAEGTQVFPVPPAIGTLSVPPGLATESTLASIDAKVATEATLAALLACCASIDSKIPSGLATEATLASLEAKVATETTLTSVETSIQTIEGVIQDDGAVNPVPLQGAVIAGHDGTNIRVLKTNASGELITAPSAASTQSDTHDGSGTPITSTVVGPDTGLDVNVIASVLPTGAATETTLAAVNTQLTSLNAVDFATETTLASILADTDSIDTKLSTTNSLLTSIDGKDFATETTLASIDTKVATEATLASLEAKDFATETTLQTVQAAVELIDNVIQADGAVNPVPLEGAVIAGTDGTNIRVLRTNASGELVVTTAGGTQSDTHDGSGTPITSTLVGADQSLDVNVTQAALPPDAATETTLSSVLTAISSLNADRQSDTHDGAGTPITSTGVGPDTGLDVNVIASVLPAGAATEATLSAIDTKLSTANTLLTSIDGKDFATETTLATRASEATLLATNTLLTSIDGKDFATEATLAAVNTTLTALNNKFPYYRSDTHDGSGTAITSTVIGLDTGLDVNVVGSVLPTGAATETTLSSVLTAVNNLNTDRQVDIHDGVGTALTSTVVGLDQALDVNVAQTVLPPGAASETTLSSILTAINSINTDRQSDTHDGAGTPITSTVVGADTALDVFISGGLTLGSVDINDGAGNPLTSTVIGAFQALDVSVKSMPDPINVNINDGTGNDLTSTTVGADQALDVNLVQSVDVGVLLKDAAGTGLTSTTVGADQALDVNVVASPGSTQSDTHDGAGTAITSTVVGADTGLDVNVIGGVTLDADTNVHDGVGTPITSTDCGGGVQGLDVKVCDPVDVTLNDHLGNGIDSTVVGPSRALNVVISSPTGLATSANQVLHNTKLDTIITNTTGLATEATLSTLAATDFATETTLASLNSKDFATQTTLLSVDSRLATLNAKDFATETTLSALNSKDFATETTLASLEAKDFATQTTLAAAAASLVSIDTKLSDDKVDVHSGTGVAITSTVVGPDTGLDVNVLGTLTISGDVNVNDGVGNDITSTVIGPARGLDVNVVGGVGDASAANQVITHGKLDTLISQTADVATETTLAALNSTDFATETTLTSVDSRLATLNTKDFATETTLSAVKTSVELIDDTIITDGQVNPAPLKGAVIAGTDGSNVYVLRTNASGELITAPSASSTQSDTHDGAGTPITSTVVGPDTGLDVNVIASALPTGAATEATLSAINTKLADDKVDIHDGAGNALTSTTVGADQALDVNVVASPGSTQSDTHDGAGVAITSTLVGADQALDVNVAQSALPTGAATETTLQSIDTALAGTLLANVNVRDAAGNGITSTLVGPDRGLDVNVIGTVLPPDAATETTLSSVLTAVQSIDTDRQFDHHDGNSNPITSTVTGLKRGIDTHITGIDVNVDAWLFDHEGNGVDSSLVGADRAICVDVKQSTDVDVNLRDAAGIGLTSTTVGADQALDVNVVASPGSTQSDTHDGVGTAITSTVVAADTGLDVFIINDPFVRLQDAAGTGLTSTLVGADQALDVNIVAGGGGGTQSDTHDGAGTAITSTVVGPDTGLDVNVIASALPTGAATETTLASVLTSVQNIDADRRSDTHDGVGNEISSTLCPGGERGLDVNICGGGLDTPPLVSIADSVLQTTRVSTSSTARTLALEWTVPDGRKFYIAGFVVTKYEINSIDLDPGEIGWTTDGGTNFFDIELESQKGAGNLVEWVKIWPTPIYIVTGSGTDVRLQVWINASGSQSTDWFVRFTGVLED